MKINYSILTLLKIFFMFKDFDIGYYNFFNWANGGTGRRARLKIVFRKK